MNKKIILGFLIIIFIVLFISIINNTQFITDSDYLYDVAIEFLKEKYTEEETEYNQKEDFQIFFEYTGFGISQEENIKYAYMWISEESCYVENGELKGGSGSSMPYKITFENDKVIDFEVPQDGTYYTPSIKNMFPDEIAKEILNFNYDDTNLRNKINEHYSYLNTLL